MAEVLEAIITINGVRLTPQQSKRLRAAVIRNLYKCVAPPPGPAETPEEKAYRQGIATELLSLLATICGEAPLPAWAYIS